MKQHQMFDTEGETMGKVNWSGGKFKSCYHSHPPLPIGDKVIYGGNCGSPVHLDCHVYVALQSGSRVRLPQPWEEGYGAITQVDYPILDMGVPTDPKDFKKLIEWLRNQLQEGKKVHVGCIGGHGRTGMVLSALVAVMLPEEPDAIGYVRKNYCDHAVESVEQVQFLNKHFGCKVVKGYKEGRTYSSGKATVSNPLATSGWSKSSAQGFSAPKSSRFAGSKKAIEPVPSARNIFAVIG
jgi:hypothetical protein